MVVPQTLPRSGPLEPVNEALFGKGVFADVTKSRTSGWDVPGSLWAPTPGVKRGACADLPNPVMTASPPRACARPTVGG